MREAAAMAGIRNHVLWITAHLWTTVRPGRRRQCRIRPDSLGGVAATRLSACPGKPGGSGSTPKGPGWPLARRAPHQGAGVRRWHTAPVLPTGRGALA